MNKQTGTINDAGFVQLPTDWSHFRDKVLAVDLGSTSGLCIYADGFPYCTRLTTAKTADEKRQVAEDPILRYVSFRNRMRRILESVRPDICVYEEPPAHFKSVQAARILFGLRTLLLLACHDMTPSVPTVAYAPTELKKWATGKGNAKKPQMVEAANNLQQLAFKPTDTDTADAYLLARFYLAERTAASA